MKEDVYNLPDFIIINKPTYIGPVMSHTVSKKHYKIGCQYTGFLLYEFT